MGREKLRKHLLEMVREFSEVFGIGLPKNTNGWADGIRQNHDRAATLPVGGGRNIIWTKEKGQRKLVFQTPQSYMEVEGAYRRWLAMPSIVGLKKRNIFVGLSSHTLRPEDVIWGADEDVLPPNSQGER